MRGYLVDYSGYEYKLPVLTSWQTRHTDGSSCDSFEVSFVYSSEMGPMLEGAVNFYGEYEGEIVFYGIVDEYEINISDSNTVTVSGRGLAGRLMDNEAEAADFYMCSMEDILTRYVRPFGVRNIDMITGVPSLWGYSVTTGQSCWSALTQFTEKAAGITPRFSRDGRMIISSKAGKTLKISFANSIFDVSYKNQRYGIVSSVIVKTIEGRYERVTDEKFVAEGGCAQRVTMVTKDTARSDMAYEGQKIIRDSKKGKKVLSISLPALFAAQPEDRIIVDLEYIGLSGEYRVTESISWADEDSCGTRLNMTLEE